MSTPVAPTEQRTQLAAQRRKVDFDTYDVTVDELLRRVSRKRIDIAPVYQRQFRWDKSRQSRLIESVMLGIPVPPLFMATNSASGEQTRWEVVDGLQRLLTLVNFAGDEKTRSAANLDGDPLRLTDLEKLTTFEGYAFDGLSEDIRTTFEDRPLKIIILNDKSELQVRYDLFERLNTGGIELTDQEIRECVYRGEFVDLLGRLAQDQNFNTVVKLPTGRQKDGTREDYVLRFFAFLDRYQKFDHSVKDFLDDFIADAHKSPRISPREAVFNSTFSYLASCFPDGLKSRKGQTPVNLFEAVSVGAALALRENPKLKVPDMDWVFSDELRAFVTGATNSRPRVRGRIEFAKGKFLG
ncbi:DUF262 domain-containing protein [Streptomyces sp. NBC_00696]|uniref:DUF262 domain-containing protein n=1 Tax=Streptomyces sp. NBC_00696 TaxID=2903672 RepID=UPI002E37ADA4|nr:DUF262 domain-containing protein [Streptomyces sp. NBC_00696]